MAEEKITLRGTRKELMELIPQVTAIYQLIKSRDIGHVYGVPVTTFQDLYEFAPQVKLMFYQTKLEAGDDNPPATGEVNFRITGETHETFTEAKALLLANKIDEKFALGTVFVWHKGKQIVSYIDKAKGYKFQLYVPDEVEGRRIIEQVLDIRGHSPDWNRLTISKSTKTFPDIPSREIIYGQSRRTPRRRPVEDARFRYAELHIWGLTSAVTLVDTTGCRPDPLVVS